MRCGLGLVFLIFGAEKLVGPEQWVIYLSPAITHRIDAVGISLAQFFRSLGVIEVLLALFLLAGVWHRIAALWAALELTIIIASVGLDHTGVRDIGLLLGLALPLAFLAPDDWSLGAVLRRLKVGNSSRWTRVAGWSLAASACCVVLGFNWFSFRGPAGTPGGSSPMAVSARVTESVRNEPIRPIPQSLEVDTKMVALGRRLFNDVRLSGNDTLSCAHCHNLRAGGVDGQRVSAGIYGRTGQANAPTVLNAALNVSQFWDGRAADLAAQVDGPVTAPEEMGGQWGDILAKLKADARYQEDFQAAFGPRGLTRETVAEAIAHYERTLLTPDSRFDQWLRGDDAALSTEELSGYQLFKQIGCVACHQGALAGGNMYQTMGKFGDYFRDRGGPLTRMDQGRFNVTGHEADRHKFKVPGLRNIALTAPYFHDGSARTLEDAVGQMGRYQLGRPLNPSEVGSIVSFLKTLTGPEERTK